VRNPDRIGGESREIVNAALILAESEDFVHVKERVQEARDFCESAVGNVTQTL
jgi:hypothetical protein